jgi:hypothetical protein
MPVESLKRSKEFQISLIDGDVKTVSDFQENHIKRLQARVVQLENAILAHATTRLDDRCWLDDLNLYRLVGIEEHPGLALPESQFLSRCQQYWHCQQTGVPYISQNKEAELGRRLLELVKELDLQS